MQLLIESEVLADLFGTSNETKKAVYWHLYFSAFSSPWIMLVAIKDCDLGIPIQSPADGSIFNLRWLQVRKNTIPALARDLIYADDCALLAHTLHDAQQVFDRFWTTVAHFGLTVSLKKTEVINLPVTKSTHSPPVIKASDVTL